MFFLSNYATDNYNFDYSADNKIPTDIQEEKLHQKLQLFSLVGLTG